MMDVRKEEKREREMKHASFPGPEYNNKKKKEKKNREGSSFATDSFFIRFLSFTIVLLGSGSTPQGGAQTTPPSLGAALVRAGSKRRVASSKLLGSHVDAVAIWPPY